MRNRRVGAPPARWTSRSWPAFAAGALLLAASPLYAQTTPAVSVGAGLRTSFVTSAPDGGDTVASFGLDSARLYFNGTVTKEIKFMFNTEYNGATHSVDVIDAVAQMSTSDRMNIWFGRFLPPSDRANLYGPYYSNAWGFADDGVQDGYPFIAAGRDDGVAYWGQFGKVKLSGGLFDGASLTGDTQVLVAARAQVDFWDPEGGYYLNGTYYGDKNLLAIGGAVQAQDGNTASSADFLMEKKLKSGGTVSVEAEYADYDKLGGYESHYTSDAGGYIQASYLFPKAEKAMGAIQLLGKYAQAKISNGLTPEDIDFTGKTTEFNLNYVMKQFNARLMIFFRNESYTAVKTNQKSFGAGLQIQM